MADSTAMMPNCRTTSASNRGNMEPISPGPQEPEMAPVKLLTILSNFTGAISGSWGPGLMGSMLPLLLALVVLQFGIIAVESAISRDVPYMMMYVVLGIMRV